MRWFLLYWLLSLCFAVLILISLAQASEVLSKVTSPKLHLQYAKAREADGAFKEAVAAYETARDYESVIRIQLKNLKNPDEAVRIVKVNTDNCAWHVVLWFCVAYLENCVERRSENGCRILSAAGLIGSNLFESLHHRYICLGWFRLCDSISRSLWTHWRGVIGMESHFDIKYCRIQVYAFQLAQQHNKMDIYALVIGDSATDGDFAMMV